MSISRLNNLNLNKIFNVQSGDFMQMICFQFIHMHVNVCLWHFSSSYEDLLLCRGIGGQIGGDGGGPGLVKASRKQIRRKEIMK